MPACILYLLALTTVTGQTLSPGDHNRSLEVGSLTRSYCLHIPPKYDMRQPTPVVLLLHGLGMNGKMMLGFGVKQKSDAAGFVAVCPNGVAFARAVSFWNCGDLPMDETAKPDDVAFIARLLNELETLLNVDRNRVYVVGLSNGGMMAHRLAIELSDRIAAIATISGALAVGACNPKRPVPVLLFHGTEDRLVPFDGPAEEGKALLSFKSVDETAAAWVKADGGPVQPKIRQLPDKARDGTTVTRKTYGPGKDGAEVVLYVIEGGGHTWPGVPWGTSLLGKTTLDISATDLIWEFFEKHPLKN